MAIISPDELSECVRYIKIARDELRVFKREKGVVSKKLNTTNKQICFLKKYLPFIGNVLASWFLIEKRNKLKEKFENLDDFQDKIQDKILAYQRVIDFFKADQIASGEVKKLHILLLRNLSIDTTETTNLADSPETKETARQRIQLAINFIERDMRCFFVGFLNSLCSI